MEGFILQRWEIIKSIPEVFIAFFFVILSIAYIIYKERISGYKNSNAHLKEQLQSLELANSALRKENAERQQAITEVVKYNKTLKSQLEQSQFELAELKAKVSQDKTMDINPRTFRSDR